MYSTPPLVAGAIRAHKGGTRAMRNLSMFLLICCSSQGGVDTCVCRAPTHPGTLRSPARKKVETSLDAASTSACATVAQSSELHRQRYLQTSGRTRRHRLAEERRTKVTR